MSEDENFWLTQYRENFQKELRGLKTVTTNEELKEQTKRVNAAREKLLEHDEEFRLFIEANQANARLQAEAMRYEANEKTRKALAKANSKGKYTLPPRLPRGMTVRKR